MAITCESTITPIDIAKKIVKISANITKDAEPAYEVVVENADISTPEKKAAVADVIWKKYLFKRNQQIALDNIQPEINQLQNDLNSNIEGRAV